MAVNLKAIEQLATDQASLKAAAGLAKPAKWSGISESHDAALVWGECAGSGANPYRVMADLRDLGSKCTCPSRKFPCKHVLALFWLKAEALAPFSAADTPDWVSDWLGLRRTGGSAKVASVAAEKDLHAARITEPDPVEDEKATARREAASARRAEETQRAIIDALDALEQWIGDQLRMGLGGFIDDVAARCRRIGSRLVDGKAAALAGQIDEMPARFRRQQRRIVDLDDVVLCVDQSGSMATSVVYASIFAAVMASLPVVATKLVCFDTAIVDLTEELADPVEVLFGVQLGGGTDINRAVAYCEDRIERPAKSHMILITDLYEGGDGDALLGRLARLALSGVNVIVLLALTDRGRPSYDPALSAKVASLGLPVFACTPDQFPDLMAAALRREDVHSWAADRDIKLIRSDE